ncbi:type II toxin-antitoxin system PemK/MazF family toxin [Micromonospora sp. WMMD1102]|uniref:type II toxin-antitoxin system PemK/MazF family toxin n=1 Tax=Micromonospora sp. WMMD1102 TaxID=3016105 RepID=UPI002414FF30|nr:type II toxin-antitoxin system PemK/MazF family toxin [Micromonospora sp. WMMD1102]MDG4790864.1 type II toxin-antitoxin system PemK/MazF family toxin [Micromonospora sp. WMMD1102]
MRRGQIWTLLRGNSQHRVLVISNDEYNSVEELAIWALTVVRDVPHPNHLAVRLGAGDPLAGTYVRIHSVVQILDRTALRDSHGFVSHTTMGAVEIALREFLELP